MAPRVKRKRKVKRLRKRRRLLESEVKTPNDQVDPMHSHFVYLLANGYVGYTTRPWHRQRAHWREIAGGPKRTLKASQAGRTMIAVVGGGFLNVRDGLRFEWLLGHRGKKTVAQRLAFLDSWTLDDPTARFTRKALPMGHSLRRNRPFYVYRLGNTDGLPPIARLGSVVRRVDIYDFRIDHLRQLG